LLQTLNISGYTIIPAQGAGGHGRRMGDMADYNTNIEVKTIVSPEISRSITRRFKTLSSKSRFNCL
jgi:hypothetical protein